MCESPQQLGPGDALPAIRREGQVDAQACVGRVEVPQRRSDAVVPGKAPQLLVRADDPAVGQLVEQHRTRGPQAVRPRVLVRLGHERRAVARKRARWLEGGGRGGGGGQQRHDDEAGGGDGSGGSGGQGHSGRCTWAARQSPATSRDAAGREGCHQRRVPRRVGPWSGGPGHPPAMVPSGHGRAGSPCFYHCDIILMSRRMSAPGVPGLR